MTLTPTQRAAIDAEGQVIVAAGAGTGKTRVLVERCLDRLRPDRKGRLSRMLLVTFTEAAAAEMKERIRGRLAQERDATADPARRHWWDEQLVSLDTAYIGTLHGFCLRLAREHFYRLGWDPQFSVLDEAEARQLKVEVWDTLLRDHPRASHAPAASAFRSDLEIMLNWIGFGGLSAARDWIFRIHTFSRSLPNPHAWLRSEFQRYDAPEPTRWRAQWLEAVQQWREHWQLRLSRQPAANLTAHQWAARLAQADPALESDPAAALVREATQSASAPWPRGSKEWRDAMKDFFAEAAFLDDLAPRLNPSEGPDPLLEDWPTTAPVMRALAQATETFSIAYANTKRQRGLADFSDLEHSALTLLRDPDTQQPTSVAETWRGRFDWVFVDEYQDINRVQDHIVEALTRAGPRENRFLVGDVKQSIYRFRLTDPTIFQNYIERARTGTSNASVLFLRENFRSRPPLLAFVNRLFADLAHVTAANPWFDTAFALEPGRIKPDADAGAFDTEAPVVECHLVLPADTEPDASAGEASAGTQRTGADPATEREARTIGWRIIELQQSGERIWDEARQEYRPIRWNDIAILLRAPTGKAEAYGKVFNELRIPLQTPARNLFDTVEVRDVLSLLHVLDNPLQDVPLLAVLRSPFVGLSTEDLARIRAAQPQGEFWTALNHVHERGRNASTLAPATDAAPEHVALEQLGVRPEAWLVIDRFRARLARWRKLARDVALSQRLELMLADTGYLDWLRLQPNATQRLENVRAMTQWAQEFDALEHQGLAQFLEAVQAREALDDIREPPSPAATDGVLLTSIHRSKGLEFPVVIVADLGKVFNLDDLNQPLIVREELGFAPLVRPRGGVGLYPSPTHWLASRRERTAMIAEELRLLYVATTRARERLLLFGSARLSTAEKWHRDSAPGPIVTTARRALDWIGPWLAGQIASTDWLETGEGVTPLFRWRIHRDAPDRVPSSPDLVPPIVEVSPETWRSIESSLTWRYAHARAIREPAKASVSALRRRTLVESEETAPFWTRAGRDPRVDATLGVSRAQRPRRSGTGYDLSPAQRGTAHHAFLEQANWDTLSDLATLRHEAERLVELGGLTAAEAESLDLGAILKFWRSRVGRWILERREAIHRELPFTLRLTPAEAQKAGLPEVLWPPEGEFVVIQGVVDLAVVQSDRISILDFKTDRVDARGLDATAAEYRPQLELYASALERIYRRPVDRLWLHFLSANRTVELR